MNSILQAIWNWISDAYNDHLYLSSLDKFTDKVVNYFYYFTKSRPEKIDLDYIINSIF